MKHHSNELNLSIVTIAQSYNDDLIRCINSCNFKNINFEHIIVMPKNADLKIIKKIKKNNLKIITDKGNGVYPAINTGLKYAKGNHIFVLHGDNYLLQNSNEFISTQILKSKETIQFGCYYETRNGEKGKFINFKNKYMNLLLGIYPPHPGLVLSRKDFQSIGFLDENYKICSDFLYYIDLHKFNSSINHIQDAVVVSPLGGSSTNGFSSIKVIIKERIQILDSQFIRLNFIYLFPILLGYLVKILHRIFQKNKYIRI